MEKSESSLQMIEKVIEAHERAQAEMLRIVKEEIGRAALEIFDAHPKLESFGWKQYSLYFNDGDPCYFRVRAEDGLLIVNDEEVCEAKWYEEKDWTGAVNPDYDAELTLAADAAEDFVLQFTEETLQNLFGDHKEIYVTREGLEVSDYRDHD